MERFGSMAEAVCSVFQKFVIDIGYNINYRIWIEEKEQGSWESMERNEVQSKVYNCKGIGKREIERLNVVVFRLPCGEYEVLSYLMK